MVKASALDLIENTPLVELARLHRGLGRIVAKAEFIQPGGSMKDRAALYVIRDAYAAGKLVTGQRVVEMTSGNMGAGLAVVCNVFGNPFTAIMSEGNSPARAKMLEALGAKVILFPQVDGSVGRVTGRDISAVAEHAITYAKQFGGYYVDQFNNVSCVEAHYYGTGPEIWSAIGRSLNAFVAGAGTGATFIGVSRYLKEQNPAILCAAVEPAGARVLAGEPVKNPRHLLQGMGYGIQLPCWQSDLVDDYMAVTDEDAAEYRHLLATREGLHVGFSAAANVCAAVRILESGRLGPDATVATVLCDTGLKY